MKKSVWKAAALAGVIQLALVTGVQAEVSSIDGLLAGGRPPMSKPHHPNQSTNTTQKRADSSQMLQTINVNVNLDQPRYDKGKRLRFTRRTSNQPMQSAITSEDVLPAQDGKFKFRDGQRFDDVVAKANSGDVASMNELGLYYFSRKDNNNAVYWLTKASDQGYTRACNTLGAMYERGQGVQQNVTTAKYYYEKSTTVGDVVGVCLLGAMLLRPSWPCYDPYRACDIFRRGAEQGWRDCEYYYGLCWEHGWGCERDLEHAAYWYNRGYLDGCEDSSICLGRMYRDGLGVDCDYVAARELFEDAARYDSPWAECELGKMYYSGLGVEKDEAKAMHWFQEAAGTEEGRELLQDISKGKFDDHSWLADEDFLGGMSKHDQDALSKEVGRLYDEYSASGTGHDSWSADDHDWAVPDTKGSHSSDWGLDDSGSSSDWDSHSSGHSSDWGGHSSGSSSDWGGDDSGSFGDWGSGSGSGSSSDDDSEGEYLFEEY